MPEPVRYRNKGTQHSTRMLQIRTGITNVGLLMPAPAASMPVLSYGNVLHMYLGTREYVYKVAKISMSADQ
jgi:hypothetical protein